MTVFLKENALRVNHFLDGGDHHRWSRGANSEEIVDFEERNERLEYTTEGLLALEF